MKSKKSKSNTERKQLILLFSVIGVAFAITVAGLVFAAKKPNEKVGGQMIEKVREGTDYNDGEEISEISEGYRSFVRHQYNVDLENPEFTPKTEEPTATPEATAEAVPTAAMTPEPTEEPTAKPAEDDFITYAFDINEDGVRSKRVETGAASGISADNVPDFPLIVGEKGKDLDFGGLKIQNPYEAEGFDLREVLEKPLVLTKTKSLSTPKTMIYYTHTSESYCKSAAQRTISKTPKVSGYDNATSIVGRGIKLESTAEDKGVGVINAHDINDADYEKAYEESGKVTRIEAANNKSLELAIDLHVNAFEHPAGVRFAPIVTKDGKNYAKVLLVVSQNETEHPNWRENVKIAMIMAEKLDAEVPGIVLGIELRADAKYNTNATKYSLLAELGFEGNLVSEADNTAVVFGKVLAELYTK